MLIRNKTRPHRPSVAQARQKLRLLTQQQPYAQKQLLAQAFAAGLRAGASSKGNSNTSAMLEFASRLLGWR